MANVLKKSAKKETREAQTNGAFMKAIEIESPMKESNHTIEDDELMKLNRRILGTMRAVPKLIMLESPM